MDEPTTQPLVPGDSGRGASAPSFVPTSVPMTSRSRRRAISRGVLAAFMVFMGVLHFVAIDLFVQIVPPFLPAPRALVWLSAVFDVLLGAGLLVRASRRWSSFGLAALFVAIFPANIYMAVANVDIVGLPSWFPHLSETAKWVRLPVQLAFIWWALRAGRD